MFMNILVINTVISGFNMVILASILLVWSLYFYESKRFVVFIALITISLLGIGNPLLWGAGISLYLFMRSSFKMSLLVLLVTATVSYISSIYTLFPLYNLQYLELGRTGQEIFTSLINNPVTPIEILTRENFLSYYLRTLIQFPLLIVNPISWLLVLPNFAERFLSINQIAWTDITYFGFILSPLAIYISVLALAKMKNNLRLPSLYQIIALIILVPSLIIGILNIGFAPNSRLRALIMHDNIELVSENRK